MQVEPLGRRNVNVTIACLSVTIPEITDTTSGSSGGPIIAIIGNQPYIVALNNAELKPDGRAVINLGVKIDFLDRCRRN